MGGERDGTCQQASGHPRGSRRACCRPGWVGGVPSDGRKSGTLIFHWDGTAWTLVNSPSPGSGPNQLEGVSAVSGSDADAWAVGNYSSLDNPGASRTLHMH